MLKTHDTRIREFSAGGRDWDVADLGDGCLLDRFIDGRDESAFAEIVRRHGLMVLGVCKRVLDNQHDAEDCFQAAFLVLARKAPTIQPRDRVGNWLYGVAYRTALEARKLALRRRNLERKKQAMPKSEPPADLWQDLRPVLDQEISRLPESFRAVLVACDLEGMTRSEAAEHLGLPEGTVASRLARARGMLAKRLRRHRIIVMPSLLREVFAQHALPPELPESLVLQAAWRACEPSAAPARIGRIVDAVENGMVWDRLKMGIALGALVGLLIVGGAAIFPAADAGRKPEAVKPEPVRKKPKQITECILEKIDPKSQLARASQVDAESGAERTVDFRVTPETVVVIANREARLADLDVGMVVRADLQYDEKGRAHAVRIEAIGQSLSGTVESMEASAITIVAAGHVPGEGKKYLLDESSKVKIDGRSKKPADIKSKMNATLRLDPNGKRVVAVEVAGPKVEATVRRVDAKGRRLDVEWGGVAEGVAVSPDAIVAIRGQVADLSEVSPGMTVSLQLSAETPQGPIVAIRVR